MNARILAAFLASAVSAQAFSAAPPKVFINIHIATIESCNFNRYASLNDNMVRGWVKEKLEKTGYAIANSKSDATNGMEARVRIILCGTYSGDVESHSASIGFSGLSNGTSVAAPALKDVPFYHSSTLSVAAGSPENRQLERIASYIQATVTNYVGTSFQ